MPVTAKLSKLFYDRLGDQIAQELVDWFNQVDATYRADLRELNELNFARFDAKLEQRLAELHAKLDAKIERVAAELEAKLDARIARVVAELEARLETKLEAKLGELEARLEAKLDAKLGRLATELHARIDQVVADFHAVLERRLGEQTRWLFIAWASLLIPIMGLWLRA